MPPKPESKTAKLSDAQRHDHFKKMAKEVGASDKPKDFDRAFRTVTAKKGKAP